MNQTKVEEITKRIKYWSQFYSESSMRMTKENLTMMIKEAETELSIAQKEQPTELYTQKTPIVEVEVEVEKPLEEKPEFRLIIAGSRNYSNAKFLVQSVDKMLIRVKDTHDIVIISGGAKGADTMGEKYAKLRGYKMKQFQANWDTHGKSAGHIRNKEMANYVSENKISDTPYGGCLIFYEGKESTGSKNMFDLAKKMGIPTKSFINK